MGVTVSSAVPALVARASRLPVSSINWELSSFNGECGSPCAAATQYGKSCQMRSCQFGPLAVANAFSPVLAANGGGTLLNILSSAAWISVPTGYGAAKAAMWSATNGLRLALEAQHTHVAGLLVGMIDTPMSARWDMPKVSAEHVVTQAYDGIAAGLIEILADEMTQGLKLQLSTKAETFYPLLHEQLRSFVA